MEWSKYKAIYTEVWKLHKKHFGNTDWDKLVVEMRDIDRKYRSPFCEALLIAVAEDLNHGERRESE